MDHSRPEYIFGRLFVLLLIVSLIVPAQLAAAETTIDAELPDLVITSLGVSSLSLSPGERVVITATVTNIGTAGAEGISESIFVDGTRLTTRGDYSLRSGQSVTREFGWVASEGAHGIKWLVDPEATIRESNEDNNFRVIEVHVAASGLPDLTITSVFVDRDLYEPGDIVLIKAVVKNQGNGIASGVRDVLIVDDRIAGDSDTYSLAPGQSIIRQYRWVAVQGTHTLVVVVDPGNRIEETNEDNNAKSVRVKITVEQGNSAQILSILIEKDLYERGDSVKIGYTVKNTGEIRLHLRLIINIIAPDGRYVFDSIAGGEEGHFLSPGQQVSGRLSWIVPRDASGGVYRIDAILAGWDDRELIYDTKKGEDGLSFRVGVAFPIQLISQSPDGRENIGSISVSTVGLLEFPARLLLPEGLYRIQVYPPEGYRFDHFFLRGAIRIVADSDDPTKVGIAIEGEGSILVVFALPAYFEVEAEPRVLEIHPGGTASTVVFIVPHNEFSGFVNLRLDWRDHLRISGFIFEPDSITLSNDGARSHLSIKLADSAIPGDYVVRIVAQSGDFVVYGIIKLKVVPTVVTPEYTLVVLPLEPSNNQVVDRLPINLKVQVLSPDSDSPLQGVKVTFLVKGFEDEWVTRSDSSGYAEITISDIAPGEYGWIARATKDGFNPGSSRVQAFNIISDVKKVEVPQLGVPYEGKFTREDEVHRYAFEFEAGKTYLIKTFELDGVDTVIALLTEEGSKVARDDDSGEGLASKIVFTAKQSGIYFLKIWDYWDVAEGSYLLLVTETVSATLIVNIEHTYIGDLEIWVGIEGGREVKIWSRDGSSSDDIRESWNLGTFGFTVEDLSSLDSQRWYLKVRDNAARDEGMILKISIEYNGRTYTFIGAQEIRDFQESLVWLS